MWLINAETLRLEYFVDGAGDTPEYAILSHTWGTDEITFQDIHQDIQISSGAQKTGFLKVADSAAEALRRGLRYLWVDTCCIDKKSNAELSESINSMFKWDDLLRIISIITGIADDVLSHDCPLSTLSAATKMFYAANRKTTRPEDLAYCLLGLFDVNMPLIYGEGMKAFRRLQEEIIKQTNDMTIFAWESSPTSSAAAGDDMDETLVGLFASHPSFFNCRAQTRCLHSFGRGTANPDFVLTNKGLQIETWLNLMLTPQPRGEARSTGLESSGSYMWPLGYKFCEPDGNLSDVGLKLVKVAPHHSARSGAALLVRDRKLHVALGAPALRFFIQADMSLRLGSTLRSIQHSRYTAVHLPILDDFELHNVVALGHWDGATRTFLEPFREPNRVYAARYLSRRRPHRFAVAVLIDCSETPPRCRIFDPTVMHREHEFLFHVNWLSMVSTSDSLCWHDLWYNAPALRDTTEEIRIAGSGFVHLVSDSLMLKPWQGLIDVPVYSLRLTYTTATSPVMERDGSGVSTQTGKQTGTATTVDDDRHNDAGDRG